MFKKLKFKFIVTTMILLTSIVLLICGSIYLSTKKNSEYMLFSQLSESLNSIKSFPNSNASHLPPFAKDVLLVTYDMKTSKISYANENFISGSDTISEVIQAALNTKKEQGFISVSDYNLAYMYKTSPNGIEMVFKDSSLYTHTINRLIITSVVISLISIVVLYIFSVFLANKTIKPVEESYNSQKRFIADASHELKTPLAVIKTNLDIINTNRNDTVANQGKWLNYISFQTDRMSTLVTNLLFLAKADNNELLGVDSTFNISQVIMNQLLSFEAVLYENNLELDSNINKNINFFGDKESINQLVGILMDNAIKHSFKDSIITANLKESKNKIYFSVTNNGETIPKEDIDKIFDRFYRVDKSRAREKGGYGLGLSIAKSIVDKYNGKIKAVSENNITSFIVELNLPSCITTQKESLKTH